MFGFFCQVRHINSAAIGGFFSKKLQKTGAVHHSLIFFGVILDYMYVLSETRRLGVQNSFCSVQTSLKNQRSFFDRRTCAVLPRRSDVQTNA